MRWFFDEVAAFQTAESLYDYDFFSGDLSDSDDFRCNAAVYW